MSADHHTVQPRRVGRIGRALQRLVMKVHVSLYRLTNGAIGAGAAGQSFLILTTVGRKSGKKRDTPLFYFRDEDRFIIIASNGGTPKHPIWWLNLQTNPRATVQVNKRIIPITAKKADAEESKRLWLVIASKYQNFVAYQKRTTREIPIIILTPDT